MDVIIHCTISPLNSCLFLNVSSTSAHYWDQYCLTSLSATWTMQLSAPSESLPKTPSCVVQSTTLEGRDAIQRDLDRLRGGPVQTWWSSTRPSARSCTWVGAIPSPNRGWIENGLRAALRRRTWGCWLARSSMWPSNVHWQPRRPTVSWASLKAV